LSTFMCNDGLCRCVAIEHGAWDGLDGAEGTGRNGLICRDYDKASDGLEPSTASVPRRWSLREQIGQEMTAYVCGWRDAQTVADLISHPQRSPQPRPALRLQHAFTAVKLVATAYGPKTAQRWLFGANTRLGDAPAYVLRHADGLEDLRLVVPVAKTFAGAAR
jgi:hypothetical protein